jgi:hypothetical protein
MSAAPERGRNRIMVYGPKSDGTYIIEFRMADGESLAISVPAGETRVLKHFQARMPYGSSCRTFHEVKKAPASLYRGFKCVSLECLRNRPLDALIPIPSTNPYKRLSKKCRSSSKKAQPFVRSL